MYFWYEGSFLPTAGAEFMKTALLEPLYRRKPNAKALLYSLKAWHCRTTIDDMSSTTALGEAINRINRKAIEMIYSSSFFHYCAQLRSGELYSYINEELPKKQWLFELSQPHQPYGVTVKSIFKEESSVFDYIPDVDLAQAYSHMQYIEAYYLVRESIEKALSSSQSAINIAFVLPNDELKYYQDLPRDIENMLQLDFGSSLNNAQISISKKAKTSRVLANEIPSYFDYARIKLPKQQVEGLLVEGLLTACINLYKSINIYSYEQICQNWKSSRASWCFNSNVETMGKIRKNPI